MIIERKIALIKLIALALILPSLSAYATTVEYDLTIAYEDVNLTGKPAQAMTINGAVPGPLLRFKEGDFARIHVQNKMDVDTSIHWHGILVPPSMDGVPNISFPPIAPGETFTYEFPIRQSGTYWYHSHTGLQEQRGLYGSIVIEPTIQPVKVDLDYVVLLSDWTDEDPHQVLRTLKRGSEWFAIEKGSAQSIFGAARLGMLGDYFKRELQRMPAMDIADVAYDHFLANGKNELQLDAKPGETIRLRIIDGSATTYFHLEFAGGPMQIISADGIDVVPVDMQRFLIGVAETYDVLVQIPENGAYEFRATAHDGSGFSTVWLGDGDMHPAPSIPKPNLYHSMNHFSFDSLFALTPAALMGMGDDAVKSGMFDKPGMMSMEGMRGMQSTGMMDKQTKHIMSQDSASKQTDQNKPAHSMAMTKEMETSSHTTNDMNHSQKMKSGKTYGTNFRLMASDVSSSGDLAMDGMDKSRPWPPYKKLRAIKPTVFEVDKPIREIRLTLDGDMERYVWFLNNKPLSETDSILIKEGEVVRFIMINRTMMHHPLHLHGHFFRVVNGQDDHAPLKHTVDVAPMSTTVIEFNANEVGDWFFHCHLLYHMKAGMARLIHYENFVPPDSVIDIRPQLYKDSWYFWADAEVLSNMTEGFVKAANTRHTLTAMWEYGWQEVDEDEWEGLLTWDYYINRLFTIFTGLDVLGEGNDTEDTRGVLGITYLLPLNIESSYWLDSDGGGRFIFEKEFTLTPRLSLTGEAEYDTNDSEWEGKAGLDYTLSKAISITGQWHSDFGWGLGAMIRF